MRGRPASASRRARSRAAGLAPVLLLAACLPAAAGVLPKEDLDRVATLRTSFATIVVDVSQSLRQPDLSELDRECVTTISQDLMQIGQELSGYESLMKIETQLNSYSDEGTTRDVVLFALAKALDVLKAERRRLAQPPDHCARLPVSTGKARAVLQVIDATIATLEDVRSRL